MGYQCEWQTESPSVDLKMKHRMDILNVEAKIEF